jgi:hypothetical protein
MKTFKVHFYTDAEVKVVNVRAAGHFITDTGCLVFFIYQGKNKVPLQAFNSDAWIYVDLAELE